MCLHRVIGKPEKTSGIGYKAYSLQGDKIYTDCYALNGSNICSNEIKIGESYKSVKFLVNTETKDKYKTGFHIFATKAGAENWADGKGEYSIVKVRYKKARLRGIQNNYGKKFTCIIADEITLLEIVR